MNARWIVAGIAAFCGAALILFEVSVNVELAMPQEVEIPDPAVESRYQQCYQQKDDAIHAMAFGTIDNPDVQKEFISSNQARAARECRSQYPQQMRVVREPFRFNLVDLSPRFW